MSAASNPYIKGWRAGLEEAVDVLTTMRDHYREDPVTQADRPRRDRQAGCVGNQINGGYVR